MNETSLLLVSHRLYALFLEGFQLRLIFTTFCDVFKEFLELRLWEE